MVPLLKGVLVTAAGVFTGGLMVDAYGSVSPAPAPAPALATTSATAPSGQPRALRIRLTDALLTIVSTGPVFFVEPERNYSESSKWRWVDDDGMVRPGAVTVVPEDPQTAALSWGFADGADPRNTSNSRITFNLTFTNADPRSPDKCTKEWRVMGKDPKLILLNTWGACGWFECEVSEPKEYVKNGEKNRFGIFLSKKVTASPSSTHAGRPSRARQVPGGSLSISVKDDDDLRFSVSAVGGNISWPEPWLEHPVVANLSAGHKINTWIYYNLEDVAIVHMTFTNMEPSSEKCNIMATFRGAEWTGFEETGECEWSMAVYGISSEEIYGRNNGLANHFNVVVKKEHPEVTASASTGAGDVGLAGASNVASPASTTRTGSFVPAVVAVASPQSEREEDGWTSAARYAPPAFLLAAALTVAVAAAVTMRICTLRARDLQTSRFETELGLVQSAANP